jgi:hypothetical protein
MCTHLLKPNKYRGFEVFMLWGRQNDQYCWLYSRFQLVNLSNVASTGGRKCKIPIEVYLLWDQKKGGKPLFLIGVSLLWEVWIKSVHPLFLKYTYQITLPKILPDASGTDQTGSGDSQPIYPACQVQVDSPGAEVDPIYGHFAQTGG